MHTEAADLLFDIEPPHCPACNAELDSHPDLATLCRENRYLRERVEYLSEVMVEREGEQ